MPSPRSNPRYWLFVNTGEGNPPVASELPSQRPVTRSFDVYFDLRLDKRLSKHASDLRHHHDHYDVTVMWRGDARNEGICRSNICLVGPDDSVPIDTSSRLHFL